MNLVLIDSKNVQPKDLACLRGRPFSTKVFCGAMPQLGGLAVQEPLTLAGFRLPVVVITRCDRDAIRARALAAGASTYLAKPVDQQTLLDAIAAAIHHPPAPASSADNSAATQNHPEPEEYDDRQPGNSG